MSRVGVEGDGAAGTASFPRWVASGRSASRAAGRPFFLAERLAGPIAAGGSKGVVCPVVAVDAGVDGANSSTSGGRPGASQTLQWNVRPCMPMPTIH